MLSHREGFAGSLVLTTDVFFRLLQILGSTETVMNPSPPGGTARVYRALQPHPTTTLSISRTAVPVFLKVKVCSNSRSAVTVPRSWAGCGISI